MDVQKYRDSIKEKDGKINELMEDLGNKELLLSEAQASLAKVGAGAFEKTSCEIPENLECEKAVMHYVCKVFLQEPAACLCL